MHAYIFFIQTQDSRDMLVSGIKSANTGSVFSLTDSHPSDKMSNHDGSLACSAANSDQCWSMKTKQNTHNFVHNNKSTYHGEKSQCSFHGLFSHQGALALRGICGWKWNFMRSIMSRTVNNGLLTCIDMLTTQRMARLFRGLLQIDTLA